MPTSTLPNHVWAWIRAQARSCSQAEIQASFYWEHRYSPGVQSPKIRELTVHCELCMLGSTQPGFVIKTRRRSRSGPSWVAAGTCSQPPSCCCICVLPVPGCHHTPCVAADAHPCANGTASERAACVTNEVKKKPEPTTGFL